MPNKLRRGSPPRLLILSLDLSQRPNSFLLRFLSSATCSQLAIFSSYRHAGMFLIVEIARDPDRVVVLHRISERERPFLFRGRACQPTV